MRGAFTIRGFLRVVAFAPIIASYVIVQVTEPFPHGWLDHSNPHFWSNLLRAFTFLFAGYVLGMVAFVLNRSITAERTVYGGHPRRKLYRHVTLIAISHGFLIATLLFYIRERINDPLSPATPLALVGLVGTAIALGFMLSYQNSRLRAVHSAKQVLGVIEARDDDPHDLCIRVIGSAEPIALREWIQEFQGGVLARMSIEKVEEAGDADTRRRYVRWLIRHDKEVPPANAEDR